MSSRVEINESFIKPRVLEQVLDVLSSDGVVAFPSDSGYSLICRLGAKSAIQKIRQIKEMEKDHPFTLLAFDLKHLSRYARVDNVQFRLLKVLFPGAFTCILPASKEVPRLVQHEKRKTIGIRVPDYDVLLQLIEKNEEALMAVSLFDSDEIVGNLDELDKSVSHLIDLIVDAGERAIVPTTVVDLTEMPPQLIRQGAGDMGVILEAP